MARTELRVRMDGLVSIVEVHGVLDETVAGNLLEFVAAATSACRAVQIELAHIDSMTPEAAALLLFRRAPGHALPVRTSLRANGAPLSTSAPPVEVPRANGTLTSQTRRAPDYRQFLPASL